MGYTMLLNLACLAVMLLQVFVLPPRRHTVPDVSLTATPTYRDPRGSRSAAVAPNPKQSKEKRAREREGGRESAGHLDNPQALWKKGKRERGRQGEREGGNCARYSGKLGL